MSAGSTVHCLAIARRRIARPFCTIAPFSLRMARLISHVPAALPRRTGFGFGLLSLSFVGEDAGSGEPSSGKWLPTRRQSDVSREHGVVLAHSVARMGV